MIDVALDMLAELAGLVDPKGRAVPVRIALASLDALHAIKARSGRVCPLVCDHGFRADGDTCVKIACRTGYRVNDDNECEKGQDRKPVATRREDTVRRDQARKDAEAAPKSQVSGQVVCNNGGCRPVTKGCRIERDPADHGGMRRIEVCN